MSLNFHEVNEWEKKRDKTKIKKIIKNNLKREFYDLCKSNFKRTGDDFYIESIKHINFYYFAKSIFFKFKNEKKIKNQISSDKLRILNKVKKVNEIITKFNSDNNIVYIFQYSFFDKKGLKCFFGGGERYAIDLSKIIISLGYKCILIQSGEKCSAESWVRKLDRMLVIGVNAEEIEYFNVINKLNKPKLAIYSGAINWKFENTIHPSILISHGITWDFPGFNADVGYLKEILSISDKFVSVDTNTISWFRSTFSRDIKTNKISMEYVPNYVDNMAYKRHERNISNKVKILFPRRCSPERGIYLFVEIIPELLTEFPDISIDLVGFLHTKEIENQVFSLVNKYPSNISHYSVTPEEMPDFYRKADITIIPTLYSEGTSLSCIEAMASGNAIIATNIGGLPNLIIDHYNGLLINPNKEELYNGIKQLISNKELRFYLADNAYEVSKVFSKNNWENKWRKLLSNYL